MKVRNAQRRQQLQKSVKKQKRESAERQHFTQPLTGKQARHIAGAEAQTEFGPVLRAARAEKRGSVKREKQIGQAYQGVANEIGSSIERAQAGNAGLSAQIDARLAANRIADQSQLDSVAATDAATAKSLGGPTNAAGTAQMAAGDSARAAQAVALATPIAAAGQNYVDYLGTGKVATRQRGVEAKKMERSRRLKIAQDLVAGRKEKGAAKVKYLAAERTAEQEAKIDKLAFGLKKKTAGISARQAAARIAVERANAGTSARNAATSERNAATSEKSQKATQHHYNHPKKTGLTPGEKNSIKQGRQNAAAAATTLYENKDWSSWSALEKAVAKESEVSPADAKRAVAHLRKHHEAIEAAQKALPKLPGTLGR